MSHSLHFLGKNPTSLRVRKVGTCHSQGNRLFLYMFQFVYFPPTTMLLVLAGINYRRARYRMRDRWDQLAFGRIALSCRTGFYKSRLVRCTIDFSTGSGFFRLFLVLIVRCNYFYGVDFLLLNRRIFVIQRVYTLFFGIRGVFIVETTLQGFSEV